MSIKTSKILFSETSTSKSDFKQLTIAKQAEVPLQFKFTRTLDTSSHGNTRTLIILFAVGNFKYNSLGTTLHEQCVNTIGIENMSLTFNKPHEP